MQPNFVLCLLLLCSGSVLTAPTDVQPGGKGVSAADIIHPSADADAAIKSAEDSLIKVKASLRDVVSALAAQTNVHPADKVKSAVDIVHPSADASAAIRSAEDSLTKVKASIRDALSAIIVPAAIPDGQAKDAATASVTVPEIQIKPVAVSANKKYAEIIGQFIADLIQIPIVLLHAFGEAIAGLTGSKQPMLVYPGSTTASVAIQPQPPYKADKDTK